VSASKWRRVRDPNVVGLAFRVALFVGTVLNLIHHFDVFLGAPLTGTTIVQMALTYVVPYCVSTHGQVFGKR
jgi:hypothetical protein